MTLRQELIGPLPCVAMIMREYSFYSLMLCGLCSLTLFVLIWHVSLGRVCFGADTDVVAFSKFGFELCFELLNFFFACLRGLTKLSKA